jgi:hypothetical protein
VRPAAVSLGAASLGFAGFGAALLVRPSFLGVVGVALTEPAAAAEIRAFYGGLELGLAAFFARAAARAAWHRPALVAQVLAFGGVVLGRLVGLVVDGAGAPLLFASLALEAAGAGLGLWALRRTPR